MKKSTYIDIAVLMAIRSKGKAIKNNAAEQLIASAFAGKKKSEPIGGRKIGELTLAILSGELKG